jgi:flagellar biosynthesis chaperone FliJ
MKTKFDSIVKVKKQIADNIEQDIAKINSAIAELEEKIKQKEEEFLNFTPPKSGSFAEFTQIKLEQNFLKNEIDTLKSQLAMLNARKNDLLEELKKARLEYEKMKYLQGEEIKKILKQERIKEAQDMDEVAIIRSNYG